MDICQSKLCPICSSALPGTIIENYKNSSIIVECDTCGKYAMSMEFYEDNVEQARHARNRLKLAVFLKKHRHDEIRPYFSQFPIRVEGGFRNYPYEVCLLSTNVE